MLLQIAAKKRLRVDEARKKVPLSEIEKRLEQAEAPRSFYQALFMPGMSVIAEVKKASPSKGDFGLTLTVEELARAYEVGGARAISVLTEEDFFKGSATDLLKVKSAVTLPVLRKDFIIDSYQLYESRALGADAVLLIAGFLPEKELSAYLQICDELDLAAVVETHSADEIQMALTAGARIVGINNRNLQNFTTDVNHTLQLAPQIPDNVLLVSESGIESAVDVHLLGAAGADAVLVGETLVRSANPAVKIKELTGRKSA
ncbi:indole-3-glycerol phosphate synthase TrpC [Dethiobacter alkaliphilus]|uniref:indole-3-glycerol phosphate synthase TrpC n=1 Tax=Dethiobacter alkaliphilus TaxID=427926 RepID=UPI0022260A5A|nr:indole-3-glycerol phosphate synthase TrpC [Dethiobacter alkaliphilus]MCW3490773.1 indole-3-glycerol phosphate synthase TrpC [Dethiobacter alkaliphilus]